MTFEFISQPIDSIIQRQEKIGSNLLDKEAPKRFWTWDPTIKGSSLLLTDNNCIVERKDHGTPQVVVGNEKMAEGYHKWKIEVNSGVFTHDGICCGIVRPDLVKNPNEFSALAGYAIGTNGWIHKMKPVNTLPNYDKMVLEFTLDFNAGTFTVSSFQKVICEAKDIKGYMYVPFCTLKFATNAVKLSES